MVTPFNTMARAPMKTPRPILTGRALVWPGNGNCHCLDGQHWAAIVATVKENRLSPLCFPFVLAFCLSRPLWAQTYSDLYSAYAAIGFDPSAQGNAAVVFFSDAHMNLSLTAGIGPYATTNLDPRLANIVNAMNPPPTKILIAGDVSTSLSEVPGENGFDTPYLFSWATNEMNFFLSSLQAFRNVALTNILWVPGNHDQGPYETNAALFCSMFPWMPPCQSFDLAGVRFFVLNSGNYGEPSDSERAWLGQQLAATSPTQTVAVLEHLPPFARALLYRGMATMLRQLFSQWPSRWWLLEGHMHAESEAVYNIGLSNVGSLLTRTVNANQFCGLLHTAGFEVLCLSNGIVGSIAYHFDTANFDIAYGNGQFPQPYQAGNPPSGLSRRLVTSRAFSGAASRLPAQPRSCFSSPTQPGRPPALSAILWAKSTMSRARCSQNALRPVTSSGARTSVPESRGPWGEVSMAARTWLRK